MRGRSVDSAGVQGNRASFAPTISGDGRYVAFSSDASNLSGVTGWDERVHVHDTQTGTTSLVSDTTIVVAGCTGEVGKPVAKALAEHGNEVHGLARFKDPVARDEMEADGEICHAVDLLDPDLSSVPREVDHLLNFAVTDSTTHVLAVCMIATQNCARERPAW